MRAAGGVVVVVGVGGGGGDDGGGRGRCLLLGGLQKQQQQLHLRCPASMPVLQRDPPPLPSPPLPSLTPLLSVFLPPRGMTESAGVKGGH